jgi:hypothetical protein
MSESVQRIGQFVIVRFEEIVGLPTVLGEAKLRAIIAEHSENHTTIAVTSAQEVGYQRPIKTEWVDYSGWVRGFLEAADAAR